jgi:hypothetical protein
MHLFSAGGTMAEPFDDRQTPERYEETTDPKNPPNSVLNRGVRRTAIRSYLGPLVVFFLVVGIGLIYWANRPPLVSGDQDGSQIGTSGTPDDRLDAIGERGNRDDTPGGFNPDPRPNDTRSEVEYRSGNPDQPAFPGTRPELDVKSLDKLEGEPKDLVGRRIDLRNVEVVDARGASQFWIQEGHNKVEVTAPRNGPAMKSGSKVNVSGVVEEDGRGGVRVRAERVEAQ